MFDSARYAIWLIALCALFAGMNSLDSSPLSNLLGSKHGAPEVLERDPMVENDCFFIDIA